MNADNEGFLEVPRALELRDPTERVPGVVVGQHARDLLEVVAR
jgi:hypothetical protein